MKAFLIWIIVAIPLAWGVAQSVKKSLPLFGAQPKAVAPVAPTAGK